jgi:hypothetical protein
LPEKSAACAAVPAIVAKPNATADAASIAVWRSFGMVTMLERLLVCFQFPCWWHLTPKI